MDDIFDLLKIKSKYAFWIESDGIIKMYSFLFQNGTAKLQLKTFRCFKRFNYQPS